jgi:cobalt-zinc-cadmium efflux system membrane fusion protein
MSRKDFLVTLACLAFICLVVAGAIAVKARVSAQANVAQPTTAVASSPKEEKPTDLNNKVLHLSAAEATSPTLSFVVAKSGSLHQTMKLSSTIETRNPGTASVTSLLHGAVTKVLVDVGDMVKAGQVVAYINCPEISDAQSVYVEHKAHKIETQANVELIRKRLELSNNESRRLNGLLKEGISAKKDVDSAQSRSAGVEAELQTSIAMLAAADIQLKSAESRLKSLGVDPRTMRLDQLSTEVPLRSPIRGLVSQKNAEAGQPVGPLSGAANPSLFTIADLSKVWVMLEVPQSEISKIKSGANVTFTTEVAPGKKFNGRVTVLGQSFDAASRTASIRTEVDNPESILKPGMMVLAEVTVPSTSGHVLIPSSAVQKVGDSELVFKRLGPSTLKATPITVSDSDGKLSEIVHGIDAGDTIVANGSFLLKSELMRASIGGEE